MPSSFSQARHKYESTAVGAGTGYQVLVIGCPFTCPFTRVQSLSETDLRSCVAENIGADLTGLRKRSTRYAFLFPGYFLAVEAFRESVVESVGRSCVYVPPRLRCC